MVGRLIADLSDSEWAEDTVQEPERGLRGQMFC